MSENELYHYGVKGMKWGVRRDLRVLANHRRNVSVRNIKNKYRVGEITKLEKKSRIREANLAKKDYLKKTKQTLHNTNDEAKLAKMKHDIAKQTISEVPNNTLKKGATTVNRLLAGIDVGSGILTSAAMIGAVGPAAIPVAGGLAVYNSAVRVGMEKLVQMGLDKLS